MSQGAVVPEMLLRTKWLRLVVVLQFSSTYTVHQLLPWVKLDTTCSHVMWQLGSSNQILYPDRGRSCTTISPCLSPNPEDWLLLQSVSLNPSDYGWMVGVHGYEPIPVLEPMAHDELLRFTSCNCTGNCRTRRCSCRKNGVKCVQRAEVAKVLHSRTASRMLQIHLKTQTLSLETLDIVEHCELLYSSNMNFSD